MVKTDPYADAKSGNQSAMRWIARWRVLQIAHSVSYTDKDKCLQCLTEGGKALTRVSIINFATYKVIYDQLAKPPSQISDYLTRCVHNLRPCVPSLFFRALTPDFSFSEIMAQALEPITTTLADV